MAFSLYSGKPKVEWYPVTTSTAFSAGDLVYMVSNLLAKADSTSGDHVGVILKTIASTDSDYATARKVPVLVCDEEAKWLVDVGTGTLTTAMIGNTYDLKDENEIDVSAQAKNVVTVVGFVSSTKAIVKINAHLTALRVATT